MVMQSKEFAALVKSLGLDGNRIMYWVLHLKYHPV